VRGRTRGGLVASDPRMSSCSPRSPCCLRIPPPEARENKVNIKYRTEKIVPTRLEEKLQEKGMNVFRIRSNPSSSGILMIPDTLLTLPGQNGNI
jgi:hypothetical protein